MDSISSANSLSGTNTASLLVPTGKAEGNYRGERVVPQSQSLLASVAEEVGMMAATLKKDLGIDKRKVNDQHAKSKVQEVVEEYLKQVAKTPQVEKLKEEANDLLENYFKNPVQTQQFTSDQSELDISEQYLILKLAAQQAKNQPQVESKQLDAERYFNTVAEQLSQGQGAERAIIAGINISHVVASPEAKTLSNSVKELSGFYRETVFNAESIKEAYEQVLQKCPEEQLSKGIGILLRALAADYNAQNSSIEKPKLQFVMSAMSQLKNLITQHESAMALFDKFYQGPVNTNNQHMVAAAG